MQKPKSIFALLVGINDYPNPRHRLEGCVRDIRNVQEYLQAHFNNDAYAFKPVVLTDQEATRANIINGFNYFQQAENGDICLFQFSGHGSRCPVLEEFRHLESDNMHETLVCYDSRTEGGRDLLDKELSYLIWTATQGKDIHFLATLDCCHSGTATRTLYSWPRQVKNREDGLAIEDCLGFEHYKRSGSSEYSPPQGRHILLAAAQAKQTAKEVYANGKPCGIFTYCLLEALKGARNQISYSELINRVNFRVRNKVSKQSPQLEAVQRANKNLFFLTGAPASEGPVYLVAYDKDKKSWILNAGALHGITPGNENSKTIVLLADSGKEVLVEEVFAHYSTISGMESARAEQSFRAKIKEMAIPFPAVAFAENNDPEGERFIRTQLDRKPGAFFQLAARPETADYLIHAKHGHLFLSKLDEPVPEKLSQTHPLNEIRSVFKKVEGYSEASAIEFLNGLEAINRWKQFLELSNPNTSIGTDAIEIELYRTTDPGYYENDAAVEKVDWRDPCILAYQKVDGEWCRPAIQFKVKNKSGRPLWVSLLYFSDDFGIMNGLLAKKELAPEDEQWAMDENKDEGYAYRTIPINMEDAYNRWRITDVREYMKLIICTQEFDTYDLCQDGLKLDEPLGYPKRTAGRIGGIRKPDWTTREVTLHIHRSLEAKQVKEV